MKKRLLLIQYTGDYLEAFKMMQESGGERYFAHKYVLSELAGFAKTNEAVGIVCCLSEQQYDLLLPSNVRVVALQTDPDRDPARILRMIDDFRPTHVVILGPMPKIIKHAIAIGARILCIFADSFNLGRLHRFLRYGRLSHLLNDTRIEYIANHGLNSCLSLVRIGVNRRKVLPWDWPHARRPHDFQPKVVSRDGCVLYVGTVSEAKGVGDLIAAFRAVKASSPRATLHIIGGGDLHRFERQVRKFGLTEAVLFRGVVPNDMVFQLMRRAAIVVVPSRHRYPEGLPLTIYEALSARTPIVASDHPMFRGNLIDGESACIFPAGNTVALSGSIIRLLDDAELYSRLSRNSPAAWSALQIPAKWADIIAHWLGDDKSWLDSHILDAGKYADRLAQLEVHQC